MPTERQQAPRGRLARVVAAVRAQLAVRRRGPNGQLVTQRGVALVAALAVIAILYGVSLNFGYNTNIDYQQAGNARDELIARYYNRSAMTLGRVAVKVQRDVLDKLRQMLGDFQVGDMLPMFMGAFGGSREEVGAAMEALGGIAGSEYKGLGVPVGEFDLELITVDEGKINVNCGGGTDATKQLVEIMLVSLFAPREFDSLFEEPDGDGQITDRSTLVRAIIDWVDRDTAGYGSGGGAEEYGYESRTPPYKARDNYFDTIDEIQLVRGMDERRWAIFGQSFTVYGGCRVNVSATRSIDVMRAVIAAAAKDPEDPALRDLVQVNELAQAAINNSANFTDLKAFKEFVKAPEVEVPGGQATQDGAPQMRKLPGVELDDAKLQRVARVGARRVFRMKASARVRRVTKTTIGVWDAETTNQNARDPSEGRGAWVYWRED